MALLLAPDGEQINVPDEEQEYWLQKGAVYPPPPSPAQTAIEANPLLNPAEAALAFIPFGGPAARTATAGANLAARGAQSIGSAAGRTAVGRGLGAGALEVGMEMLPNWIRVPVRMGMAMMRAGGGRKAAQVAEQSAAQGAARLAPNAMAVPAPQVWNQSAPVVAAGAENLGAAATRSAHEVASAMETQLPKGYHLVTQKAGQFLRKTASKAKEVVEKAVEKKATGSAAARVAPKLVPKADSAIKGEKDIAVGLKYIKDKVAGPIQKSAVKKWITDKVPEDLQAHAWREAKRLIGGL